MIQKQTLKKIKKHSRMFLGKNQSNLLSIGSNEPMTIIEIELIDLPSATKIASLWSRCVSNVSVRKLLHGNFAVQIIFG